MSDGLKTHKIYQARAMVCTGSMTGGFIFYGPFADGEVAAEWAKLNVKENYPWDVVEMKNVGEEV